MTTLTTVLNDVKEADTKTKQPLFVVFKDIKERNEANKEKFDNDQVRKAERIRIVADWTFPHNRTYINYRNKFISVKIEDVQLADAIPVHMKTLNEMVGNDSSITVNTHGDNLIFRIAR